MYKVLIAEDEMFVRSGLKSVIDWKRFNMDVVADVENGVKALEALDTHRPDLVITDIRMPEMDGMELIRRIRHRGGDTEVIILTCLEDFHLVREAMSLGVSDYILKLTMTPAEMEDVLGKVHEKMNKRTGGPSPAVGETEQIIKENALRSFLFRGKFSTDEFIKLARELQFRFVPKSTAVCLMEIDHYDRMLDKFKDQSGQLIRMTMMNVMNEIMEDYGSSETFHDRENRYLVLMGLPPGATSDQRKDILGKRCNHINRLLSMYFNITATFVAADEPCDISEWSKVYKRCERALSFKFLHPSGSMIYLNDFDEEMWTNLTQRRLEQFLRMHDTLGVGFRGKISSEFEARIEGSFTSLEQVRGIFQLWMQRHILALHLKDAEGTRLSMEYNKELVHQETLDEMMDYYQHFIRRKVNPSKKTSLHREVEEALAYIAEHYERNVSLTEVASHVNITPNYLSSLIKKETDLSFIEYLITFRIKKAQELLAGTDLKTYEIAERTGFTDHSYFSRTFKRIVGTSPREFREGLYKPWQDYPSPFGTKPE